MILIWKFWQCPCTWAFIFLCYILLDNQPCAHDSGENLQHLFWLYSQNKLPTVTTSPGLPWLLSTCCFLGHPVSLTLSAGPMIPSVHNCLSVCSYWFVFPATSSPVPTLFGRQPQTQPVLCPHIPKHKTLSYPTNYKLQEHGCIIYLGHLQYLTCSQGIYHTLSIDNPSQSSNKGLETASLSCAAIGLYTTTCFN